MLKRVDDDDGGNGCSGRKSPSQEDVVAELPKEYSLIYSQSANVQQGLINFDEEANNYSEHDKTDAEISEVLLGTKSAKNLLMLSLLLVTSQLTIFFYRFLRDRSTLNI